MMGIISYRLLVKVRESATNINIPSIALDICYYNASD